MKMHRFAVSAFMGLVALISASNTSAADVKVESQETSTLVAATDPTGLSFLAQSFKQGASNISGAAVYLDPSYSYTDTPEIYISLWAGLPPTTTPSGPPVSALASGTASSDGNNWFKATWSPVNITVPSAYYYLVVTSNEAIGLGVGNFIDPEPDLYGKGMLYFSSALSGPYDFLDDSSGGFDLAFRTYTYENTAPVPEPETYAMMLAGLGLLGLARRRKQKTA